MSSVLVGCATLALVLAIAMNSALHRIDEGKLLAVGDASIKVKCS